MRVKKALKKALYIADMNQSQLAVAVGVAPSVVSHWFTGCRPIPHLRAVAIEKLTGGEVSRRDLAPDYPWDELE